MAETCKEKILSEDYFDWVIDFSLSEVLSEDMLQKGDFCYQEIEGEFGIVTINKNQLPDGGISTVDYYYFPQLYGLEQEETEFGNRNEFNPQPLSVSGIIRAQEGNLNLTGNGVILAFADTGINYENPLFRNADGSSRILAIWDQTIQDGTPPEGFLYGTEYKREQINEALRSENPKQIVPTTDEIGHGSQMASVAAGSLLNEGSTFRSPAYGADIVMVKLKPCKEYLRKYFEIAEGVVAYQSTDLLMAIKYLDGFASAFNRPVVFCFGLGSNFGDHAGGGILSRYLTLIGEKRSRAVVVSGGNQGNSALHYEGRITEKNGRDDVEIRVPENVTGFMVELWGTLPASFSVSVQAPGGEVITPLPVLFQNNVKYRFVYENTVISVYNALTEQGLGDELYVIRFSNPSPGIWTLRVTENSGVDNSVFHVYLPIREFLKDDIYFLQPSPDITLTTPAYSANSITVSTYNSETNGFYIQSGRGFSRSNMIKPDISAPGVNISAGNRTLMGTPVISEVTGSSMAAALCAGAAAQLMQWTVTDGNSPYVRSREIKNLLIRGAIRDNNVEYPSELWGFGKLNIYNALSLG